MGNNEMSVWKGIFYQQTLYTIITQVNLPVPASSHTTTDKRLLGALGISELMPPNRRQIFKIKERDKMGKHIREFTIHAYKGIHDLNLEHLNSINILTGDNNSGKTSVLELLSTLENPQNIKAWELCARIDSLRIRNRFYFHGFYHMFPIDNDEKKISYTFIDGNDEANTITLTAEIEETQITEREMYRINGLLRTGSPKQEEEIVDALGMHLSTYINHQKEKEDTIYDFQTRLARLISKKVRFVKTVYVSPVDHVNSTLNLNPILSDPELYEEMLSILQTFDDNITNVNALKNENSPFSTEYMVLTKNHPKALPLTAYGDGMKKAMLLLSAVVRARDGILLLDEFETAIHTSAMNSVFSWLLKSAIKLNVQVFLTSHSKEAIEKVMQCSTELQPYIHLYTLYHFEEKSYVRTMTSQEAIRAKDNLGLELR